MNAKSIHPCMLRHLLNHSVAMDYKIEIDGREYLWDSMDQSSTLRSKELLGDGRDYVHIEDETVYNRSLDDRGIIFEDETGRHLISIIERKNMRKLLHAVLTFE